MFGKKKFVEPKEEPIIKEKIKEEPMTQPKVDKEVVAGNDDEKVVNGKLYRKVAYQEFPHSPVTFRLEEVKE